MDGSLYRSISLSANASKTGPVDIFRNGGKHFRVHPQVSHSFELALLHGHGFSREALAHALGLDSALLRVDATCSVITSFPADGDGGVVAAYIVKYKVKVSMQAA